MRDLAKTLKNIEIFEYDEDYIIVCDGRNGVLYLPLTLVYEALERAIKAEAEVERLKSMVKSITSGLDEAIETNHYLENELVKYNLAFKLACKSLDETQKNYLTPGGWSLETTFLKQAERELENG